MPQQISANTLRPTILQLLPPRIPKEQSTKKCLIKRVTWPFESGNTIEKHKLKGLSHETVIGYWWNGWIENIRKLTYEIFKNHPLIPCFKLGTLVSSEVSQKGCPLVCYWGRYLSCKCVNRLVNTLCQICYHSQRALASLWQIWYKVSEGKCNPLIKSSKETGNFCM